jgi:hypothetical protein
LPPAIRTGEPKQGVVGLFQPNLRGQQTPGLAVRFMGINSKAIASPMAEMPTALLFEALRHQAPNTRGIGPALPIGRLH